MPSSAFGWSGTVWTPSVLCDAISMAAEFMVRMLLVGQVQFGRLQCLDAIYGQVRVAGQLVLPFSGWTECKA